MPRSAAASPIQIAAGYTVFTEGVSLDRATAHPYSGFGNGTVYVWGLLTRTAADQNNRTLLDTLAFVLSHVTGSGVPPSPRHIPVTVLTVAGGDITALTEPAGKYLLRPEPPTSAVSAAVTLGAQRVVLADPTAAGFTVTLAPAPADGQRVTVKNVGTANDVTVARSGSQLIDGSSTSLTLTPGQRCTLVSNGTHWFRID
jgi:hypothetical protein